MKYDSLLLAYYHPVIFDLAFSFKNLFKNVEICVVNDLKDNYGTNLDVISKAKRLGLSCIPLNQALIKVRAKKYSLVGMDGVFQGDKILIETCQSSGVEYFNISGYPHTLDEPSRNILSFSWYMPQIQYRRKYPTEGHVKQLNWSKIVDNGYDNEQKNIFVFYPEFQNLKKTRNLISNNNRKHFLSSIHKFEEFNKNSYKVFEKLQKQIDPIKLVNFSSLNQDDLYLEMRNSYGFVHLKHADCPGISLIESMLLGRVPFILKDFILASNNQEVLIDNYSAKICSSVSEMVYEIKNHKEELDKIGNGYFSSLETSTMKHANMLTDFDRQKLGLIKFFDRCLNGN